MSAAASEALLARKERLAGEVTRRFYDERPELAARGGSDGQERLRQDVRQTVEQLAPAVGLGDPTLFRDYVRESVGQRPDAGDRVERLRLLQLIRDVLDDHVPGPFLIEAHECLRLGIREVGEDHRESA